MTGTRVTSGPPTPPPGAPIVLCFLPNADAAISYVRLIGCYCWRWCWWWCFFYVVVGGIGIVSQAP